MLEQWAMKWGIPLAALDDLRKECLTEFFYNVRKDGGSEAAIQNQYRMFEATTGCLLWRNNVGATSDQNGNFIRYGLANDSEKINKVIKSADLIGIRPVLIEKSHVGTVIGQFVSKEVKAAGWKYRGTPRETAQRAWADLVISLGGEASFVTAGGK